MIRNVILCLGVLLLAMIAAAQSANAQSAPALNVPGDTVILAKLTENLDLQQAAVGQQVEAQTTQDVKQGKDVLLKKGATLVGHVTSVEPATAGKSEAMVGIIFDSVKIKNGAAQTLHLLIRALAPEPDAPYNSTVAGGRGISGETDHVGVAGVDRADVSNGLVLNASSVGVAGIPGLQLEVRKSNGQQTAILDMTKGDVKLKKGTQLVLIAVS
jgi:hypothetical protein